MSDDLVDGISGLLLAAVVDLLPLFRIEHVGAHSCELAVTHDIK